MQNLHLSATKDFLGHLTVCSERYRKFFLCFSINLTGGILSAREEINPPLCQTSTTIYDNVCCLANRSSYIGICTDIFTLSTIVVSLIFLYLQKNVPNQVRPAEPASMLPTELANFSNFKKDQNEQRTIFSV